MIEQLFADLPVDCLSKCDVAKTGLDWSVFLPSSQIVAAAERLYKAEFFLEDITAIDAKEGYLVVYHFDHFERPQRVALRVLVSHDARVVPSIASVFQGAEWHERETFDFYGVLFPGNPNPVALLLPPEMSDHPLQKTARASLADMIPPGEIVRSTTDFGLLTKPEPAAPTPA